MVKKLVRSVYFWFGIVFIVYAIVRIALDVSAQLPNDLSSTLVTLTLVVLGGVLLAIACWQVRP